MQKLDTMLQMARMLEHSNDPQMYCSVICPVPDGYDVSMSFLHGDNRRMHFETREAAETYIKAVQEQYPLQHYAKAPRSPININIIPVEPNGEGAATNGKTENY